ncbi:uncharacterized protein TNCV_2570491 [Trichonephila clavipes]|nr:uncharacterized protein TNCV_2570491 [Trichonephila clavipes]
MFRLGGVVGLSLAFCTQGCGFDPGASRWIFMMQKIDSVHIVCIVRAQVPPSREETGRQNYLRRLVSAYRAPHSKVIPFSGDVLGLQWLMTNSQAIRNKKNIEECIGGLDNLKKYLVSQRSDDNLKISVDSVKALATDFSIYPEFPFSMLRKKVYLFVYEGRDEPASNSFQQLAISSANGRFTLSSEGYSIFCFLYEFHNFSDDLMKT